MRTPATEARARVASIGKPFLVGAIVALSCWVLIHYTRAPGSLAATSIAISVLVGLLASVLAERWLLAASLRERERHYRILADYSRDLVVHIGVDGQRLYTSPSIKDMLGWDVREITYQRLDLVHPDDVAQVTHALNTLYATGGSSTITYRARHKDGHYVWIEALARRVPNKASGGKPEIIYSGRDITRRMEISLELARNQQRLRAITDNLPAFVLHVDAGERFTFANAHWGMVMGVDPVAIVGQRLCDVLDDKYYAQIKPHVDAVLRGETRRFEIERDVGGQHCDYLTTYVPDIGHDGKVVGFYATSSDITQLKSTEHELVLLARYDHMTGLANRFHFNESTDLALARQRRNGRPLALLYLDIDRFKGINDTLGHAVGDGVLTEFALRLKGCLRVTDFAARLGGDEFVVLVDDADSPEIPEIIARKVIAAMRRPIAIGDLELNITTSIGIAFHRSAVAKRDDLLQAADKALYAAKAAGRDTYHIAIIDEVAP